MCMHRSFIVTEDLKVFSHPNNDHHTEIRATCNIREEGFHHTVPHAAIEYRPVGGLFNLDHWKCVVDEKVKPTWWSKEHQAKILNALEKDHMKFSQLDSTYMFPGNLDLSCLRSLNENSTIIADGSILMDSIDYLPPNTTLIAKKHGISLQGLRHCYEGVTIIAPAIKVIHPDVIRYATTKTNHRRPCNQEEYEFRMRRQPMPSSMYALGAMAQQYQPFNP